MVKFKLITLFSMIFFISMISASGLNIVQDNIFVNKTYGEDYSIKINVTNTESFKFYNINFEEDFVTITPFDLDSGQIKEIEITIKGNSNYNGEIHIRGEYQTTIGASNKTEIIKLNYEDGFDKCRIDLIKGDKVVWVNNANRDVKLYNDDSNEKFLEILEGKNSTQVFNSPTELNYYAQWLGFRFTEICKINVINDNGLVHKLEYDGSINLNLKILYDPTTISTNFLKTSYIISANSEKSDLFSIENTGSKIAKNIHLSSDGWISSFIDSEGNEINDFDLNIGESKNIGFKITPLISETNQTNKTYKKILKIEGNFETINQEISINVPYKDVNSFYSNGTVDNSVIENFIKAYCLGGNLDACMNLFCGVFPDECENGSIKNKEVSQKFSEDTIQSVIEQLNKDQKESAAREKIGIETDTNQTLAIEKNANETRELKEVINEWIKSNEDVSITNMFLVIFILSLFSLGVLYVLISKNANSIKNKIRWRG